jgi:putative oxidoreductase
MIGNLATARARSLSFLGKLDWLGPLLVRFTVGLVFLTTGWGKLHNLDSVTQFFESLHIPAAHANAVFVSSVELVGGALLLLGLGTRVASLFLVGVMTVAIATAKLPELHGVVDLVNTMEAVYLVVFVWLLVTGAGKASLDHVLFRARREAVAL